MDDIFNLEIYSTTGCFFNGDCESLSFPSVDGSRGVIAGHEPVICALVKGIISFTTDGELNNVAVSEGFVEIMPKYVRIFVDTAVKAEEIDEYHKKMDDMRAAERKRQKLSNKQYINTNLSLKRAMGNSKH